MSGGPILTAVDRESRCHPCGAPSGAMLPERIPNSEIGDCLCSAEVATEPVEPSIPRDRLRERIGFFGLPVADLCIETPE